MGLTTFLLVGRSSKLARTGFIGIVRCIYLGKIIHRLFAHLRSPYSPKLSNENRNYIILKYEKLKFQILVLNNRPGGFPATLALGRTSPDPHMGRPSAHFVICNIHIFHCCFFLLRESENRILKIVNWALGRSM